MDCPNTVFQSLEEVGEILVRPVGGCITAIHLHSVNARRHTFLVEHLVGQEHSIAALVEPELSSQVLELAITLYGSLRRVMPIFSSTMYWIMKSFTTLLWLR